VEVKVVATQEAKGGFSQMSEKFLGYIEYHILYAQNVVGLSLKGIDRNGF
jgi:hypothetical protein